MNPLLQLFLLAVAVPSLLGGSARRYKAGRVGLGLLIPVLASLGIWRFVQARGIDRNLEARATIPLDTTADGRHSVSIAPLPGVEAVHVSLKRDGLPLAPRESVNAPEGPARWAIRDFPETSWIAWPRRSPSSMDLPDDGLPLFEIGSQPLKSPLTLDYDVTPQSRPFLERTVPHARPDWFSLKMLPPLAVLSRAMGAGYGVGILLSGILLARALRLSRRPGPLSASPSSA